MGRKIGEDSNEERMDTQKRVETEPVREDAAQAPVTGDEAEAIDVAEEASMAEQFEASGKGPEAQETDAFAARKKKRSKIISWIMIAAAAVVLVFALVNIFGIKSEDFANEAVYDNFKQAAAGTNAPQATLPPDPRDRKIDFEALRALNDEVCAWIYVPNSNIDYPVVAGEDNDYYISHSANREQNRAGAIFLEYQSNPSFEEQHTLIYGHRMNDGSMFADLHKFEDEAFLKQNPEVFIYLPDGTVNVYRIFRAGIVDEFDEAYTVSFRNDEVFEQYLEQMAKGEGFIEGTNLTAQDKVVTLSTCVRGQDTDRYIVQAALEQE